MSDSLAILPSNGGVLYKSYEPSSLDFPNENISHSSAFPKCSHITEQAMSGLTRLPSEDASSPFSLVNIDIPSSEDGTIPIVDIHPAHCSMLSSKHKDSSSSSSNKLSSTQYVPGNAINGNTPGEPLGNVDTLNSQLNHKGLVSMASDQPPVDLIGQCTLPADYGFPPQYLPQNDDPAGRSPQSRTPYHSSFKRGRKYWWNFVSTTR